MTDLVLITGTQLFDSRWLPPPEHSHVVMVEDTFLCTRLPFHQQKLAFLLASMRDHRDALFDAGYRVHYFPIERELSLGAAVARVVAHLREDDHDLRLVSFEQQDRAIRGRIESIAAQHQMAMQWRPTPMFLAADDTLDTFIAGYRRPRMEHFYRAQRKALKVLMDGDQPVGGRWNLDRENRRPYLRGQSLPKTPVVIHSTNAEAAIAVVAERFADHPGDARGLWLPTTREGAVAWLQSFLDERLAGFGTWEDAMSSRSRTGHHSVLSPFLNCGLLTPDEVVQATLERARVHHVALNDLEGFLRQVIGWREFVRGVNEHHYDGLRRGNVWDAQRSMTASWYEARTGIPPLDEALARARDWAWNHHIERLMVLANFMNLAEIAPREVYRYFMSHHIDAYDWVMAPNVYGMGLTSDGGTFATKPYVCSSNYLCRMSEFQRGPWSDVVDGLYWRFVHRHRDQLVHNPRMAMVVRNLQRLKPERRDALFSAAEGFLAEHTVLADTSASPRFDVVHGQ